MFFGPRITTVFVSRWKALGWAIGVMFSAYCAVPAVEQAKDSSDAKAAVSDAPPAGASPWK